MEAPASGRGPRRTGDLRPALGQAVLTALLEHMPCMLMTLDARHRVRHATRVPAGFTRKTVIGRPCTDLFATAGRPALGAAMDEALRTGRAGQCEVQAVGAGGAPQWFAATVLPLRGEPDDATLALLLEDITERRRCEAEVRRREAQLRAIVEGTTDAVHVKDADGRYVLVNEALCRLAGLAAADILGRDDTAFLAPETARRVMAEDRQVMDSGQVIALQFAVTRVDGEQRTLHATKGPLRDDDGAVIGVFGIARDITEVLRQEAEQRAALEQSRNLIELTLGAAELGTWDADLVAGTVMRDDRLLGMLGYHREELAPTLRQWWALIHPDDRAAVEASRNAHLDGMTRLHESEHRLRHKDGHWVWVLETGKVLRDAAGRPVRAIGTTRDISDRRRAAGESVDLLRRIEVLIQALGQGGPPSATGPAADAATPQAGPGLTARGREVLSLLAQGLTSAQIARRLGISVETASTHRRNLMRRLGLRNKAELIRYALERRIGLEPVVDAGADGAVNDGSARAGP